MKSHPDLVKGMPVEAASEQEIKQMSMLRTSTEALIVADIPDKEIPYGKIRDSFTLLADRIQDPGNFGTMIRTADWFGISSIICSPDCVDAYNPKVIQATMGSIARVRIFYTPLIPLIEKLNIAVLGGVMNGNDLFKTTIPDKGLLVIGNEGKGLSPDLKDKVDLPLTIPRYGGAESLNASIASAIICAKWRMDHGR